MDLLAPRPCTNMLKLASSPCSGHAFLDSVHDFLHATAMKVCTSFELNADLWCLLALQLVCSPFELALLLGAPPLKDICRWRYSPGARCGQRECSSGDTSTAAVRCWRSEW
jgi:hypothetical protein